MNYIFLTPKGSFYEYIYADLIHNDNLKHFFPCNFGKIDGISSLLRKIHTSGRLANFVDFPFKAVHYKELCASINNDTCVVLSWNCVRALGKRMLENLRRMHPGVKFVLLIVDSLHSYSGAIPGILKCLKNYLWDAVLSFDLSDCKRYGFLYLGYSYYSMDTTITPSDNISDLYYVGNLHSRDGRKEHITMLFPYLKRKLTLNSTVVGIDRKDFVPYGQVLADLQSSNCILEILMKNQKQQTLRYFEAVCYNKKLLTNNKHIQELPYYDERYMKYFSRLEDIDIEWIKRKEKIDYGYKGDFSPIGIINILEKHDWKDNNVFYELD